MSYHLTPVDFFIALVLYGVCKTMICHIFHVKIFSDVLKWLDFPEFGLNRQVTNERWFLNYFRKVLSKWDENAVIANGNAYQSTRLDHSRSLLTRNNFYQYSQNCFQKKNDNYPNYWNRKCARIYERRWRRQPERSRRDDEILRKPTDKASQNM